MRLSIEERQRAQSMIDFGPRSEKLLGRIMLSGFESLSEAEKIEFYLHHYRPKKGTDVQALAENLLAKFGSLTGILFLDAKELMQAEGMYYALARRFTGLGRLILAYAEYEKLYQKKYIRSVADLCRHILPLYRVCGFPGTWQLCLNEAFELIYQNEIAPSRAWGEDDAVENSITDAQCTGAKYIIIVQMCGRELSDPEPYDKMHAKIHAERLASIGCALLDVVLVDEGRITSMYELGMIKPFGEKILDKSNYLIGKDEETI